MQEIYLGILVHNNIYSKYCKSQEKYVNEHKHSLCCSAVAHLLTSVIVISKWTDLNSSHIYLSETDITGHDLVNFILRDAEKDRKQEIFHHKISFVFILCKNTNFSNPKIIASAHAPLNHTIKY